VEIKMDQEIKDYLERKLTLLATKDDIEKIRQETNANFRKLKEENKSQATEWKQEIKGDLEQLTKSRGLEPDLIQETMKEGLAKIRVESQSAIDQLRQTMGRGLEPDLIRETMKEGFMKIRVESQSAIDQLKEAMGKGLEPDLIQETMKEGLMKIRVESQSAIDQLRQTMDSSLQRMKEAGEGQAIHSRAGIDKFQDQMKKIEENMVTLEEKIREGFTGVKDELGSMIKFSYSDLEKKLTELEVRVKTLEKMVLP